MSDRERKNQSSSGKLISLILVLLFLLPGELVGWLIALAVMIVPMVLIIRFALRSVKNGQKNDTFDDCPRTFCFHKDKGEHHVKRGREIDPWDRPDIDISKYQRK